ncbi:MAG: four helix bundle protein [Gemmatimonadota bacterium]|nr:four helix bundle protein [Gemmatimonadota bacterium]
MRSDGYLERNLASHPEDGMDERGGDRARSYRELRAWQRAMELAVECHVLAERVRRRNPSLAGQLLRAATSVPANIADGNGRRTRPDYLRHLSIANGSLLDLETHIMLAARFSLVQQHEIQRALSLSSVVGRLLAGLIRRLREDPEHRP